MFARSKLTCFLHKPRLWIRNQISGSGSTIQTVPDPAPIIQNFIVSGSGTRPLSLGESTNVRDWLENTRLDKQKYNEISMPHLLPIHKLNEFFFSVAREQTVSKIKENAREKQANCNRSGVTRGLNQGCKA